MSVTQFPATNQKTLRIFPPVGNQKSISSSASFSLLINLSMAEQDDRRAILPIASAF